MAPTTDDRTTIYSDEQFSSNYPDGIEGNFWNLARNRLIIDLLRKHVEKGTRILDVGSGSGIVVDALRTIGWEAEGAEIGLASVKPSLAPFVHVGQDALAWPEERRRDFEVVMACDVIEHVADPVAFLGDLRLGFPSSRWLLITVPARRELWSNYDETYGHFLRYDMPTLRRQLTSAGFEIAKMRYAFHALYPVMAALKLAGISRTTDYKPPTSLRFERIVATLFDIERRILPGFIPGTSIVALARPRR